MAVSSALELSAEGLSLADIAVFYRTHAQSRVFEEALRALNVPYRVVGGMRFYERAEIKDLLAYLRVIHNPDDDVSLLRILNTPPRGIGKTTIERVLDAAATRGASLWRCLKDPPENVSTAPRKKLKVFCALMAELMGTEERRPSRLAAEVLECTDYLAVLQDEDNAEADARIENVRELLGTMEDFETGGRAAYPAGVSRAGQSRDDRGPWRQR